MLIYKPPSVAYTTCHNMLVSIDPSVKNTALRVEYRTRYNIQSIIFERVRFNNDSIYTDVINYFDRYYEILHMASIMVIEKQLPRNYNTVRLSQHIITYFMIRYSDSITIYEVEPRMKSKLLGYDKSICGNNVKKWSISKAIEILTQYNDINGLDILNKESKKDDLADTVCQIESFCRYLQYNI
jgi:hypothetical protein